MRWFTTDLPYLHLYREGVQLRKKKKQGEDYSGVIKNSVLN